MVSKNQRTSKDKEESYTDVLPKYNGGNVGATWKTKCAKNRQLDFSIKSKRRFGR